MYAALLILLEFVILLGPFVDKEAEIRWEG
jgi:hypothetical protein